MHFGGLWITTCPEWPIHVILLILKNELILSRLYYHLRVEVGSSVMLAMLVMSPEEGFQRFASNDLLLLHSVLWEGEEELEVPPPWASA